jgi:hypothetical protein
MMVRHVYEKIVLIVIVNKYQLSEQLTTSHLKWFITKKTLTYGDGYPGSGLGHA